MNASRDDYNKTAQKFGLRNNQEFGSYQTLAVRK